MKIGLRAGIITLIAVCIIGVGAVTYYFLSEKNILVAIASITLMYTLTKPIQADLDEWVKKDKKLKVHSIYAQKEGDLEKEINEELENLTNAGCTIEALNVLSTKRAIIQYRK
ncbi:hypothetical protein ABEV54_18200 [Peribacillus psychrosaccharolyticus]|uniref:hypothetical protein n=1 Tax=Peribacillus psychrosaccharolyticus TaxID=1407 RepID=UPI003D2D7198